MFKTQAHTETDASKTKHPTKPEDTTDRFLAGNLHIFFNAPKMTQIQKNKTSTFTEVQSFIIPSCMKMIHMKTT